MSGNILKNNVDILYTKKSKVLIIEEIRKRIPMEKIENDLFLKETISYIESNNTVLFGVTDWIKILDLDSSIINIVALSYKENVYNVNGKIERFLYEGWCPSNQSSSYNNIVLCSFNNDRINTILDNIKKCDDKWNFKNEKEKDFQIYLEVLDKFH